MGFTRLTLPAIEPVSLTEAKLHLRVDTSDDDILIATLIRAAREYCEGVQNRQYITAAWEYTMDGWPDGDTIEISLPPLQTPIVPAAELLVGYTYKITTVGTTNWVACGAASSTLGLVFICTASGTGSGKAQQEVTIKYYDTSDVEYTMSPTLYFVDTKSYKGRIVLNSGQSWPSTALRPANGVCLRFVAGYGMAPTVPLAIQHAILLMVGHWYRNREAITSGPMTEVPLAVRSLLNLDRIVPV